MSSSKWQSGSLLINDNNGSIVINESDKQLGSIPEGTVTTTTEIRSDRQTQSTLQFHSNSFSNEFLFKDFKKKFKDSKTKRDRSMI
jgi:hypothetical protein